MLETKGTKESAGGAQGRRRREGAVEEIFHFHGRVKVTSTLSFFAVFLIFVSVLNEGLQPKVFAINASKIIPASKCRTRQIGIGSSKCFKGGFIFVHASSKAIRKRWLRAPTDQNSIMQCSFPVQIEK